MAKAVLGPGPTPLAEPSPRPPTVLSGFVCPECSQEMTTVEWVFSDKDRRITLLCISCNVNHGPEKDFRP